ncbi:uncharacterized protein [Nicotiana tomentosiformis]|uniref:uncharacterized protein n=1 Tax=Nicotiana tomentosiformis TaxID=4098 RepID=UPI00388C5EC8
MGAYRLRLGLWNIGMLTGKPIELAKILQKRKVSIASVQDTRWVGSRERLEVKRHFWEGLDEVVHGIPPIEKLFIGGNFIGHIVSSVGGYGKMHGGFGFGNRNGGGILLLAFARAFQLVIVNSSFLKREEHLVTFRSMVAKTQIDFLLLKRNDRGWCEDCKIILSETLVSQP